MKKDNKKALYESIMTSVAKEVKKALNESIFDEDDYNNDPLYCNMNIKLRHGGRKAPKGGKNKLQQLMGKYGLEDFKYTIENNTLLQQDIKGNYIEDIVNEKFGITNTGLDFIYAEGLADGEAPFCFFVYWDGLKYRIYLPTKGNIINPKTNKHMCNSFYDTEENSEYLDKEFDLNIQDMDELDEIIARLSINYDACLEDFENRVEVI